MEDYIKAIYTIQNDTGERVGTSALADDLDVTSPTVSSMLKKLEEQGLVHREEYRGVTLTDEGEVVALEILRHHRLLEAFLTEQLDYDWADVHDEADRLEHHVSEELTDRIAEVLGNPGVELEVLEVAPFGLVTVRTAAGEQSLPAEIARLIETSATSEAEA